MPINEHIIESDLINTVEVFDYGSIPLDGSKLDIYPKKDQDLTLGHSFNRTYWGSTKENRKQEIYLTRSSKTLIIKNIDAINCTIDVPSHTTFVNCSFTNVTLISTNNVSEIVIFENCVIEKTKFGAGIKNVEFNSSLVQDCNIEQRQSRQCFAFNQTKIKKSELDCFEMAVLIFDRSEIDSLIIHQKGLSTLKSNKTNFRNCVCLGKRTDSTYQFENSYWIKSTLWSESANIFADDFSVIDSVIDVKGSKAEWKNCHITNSRIDHMPTNLSFVRTTINGSQLST